MSLVQGYYTGLLQHSKWVLQAATTMVAMVSEKNMQLVHYNSS